MAEAPADNNNNNKRIGDVLSAPIKLSEQIRQAVDQVDSFKSECLEINKRADRLSQMFRSAVRFATSATSLYETPVRRISADVTNNLHRALTLVVKCKRRNVLRRVVTIVTAADFRKVFALLDASVGDTKWLIGLFDLDGAASSGMILSLPPIASNDPILSLVWSIIATIYLGQMKEKIEAVNGLTSLAKDNDRNKMIIIEEGGIKPLVTLLTETASPEAQISAASALFVLANDQDRVRLIANELVVPITVNLLGNASMRVQIQVAYLVARMAEYDSVTKEAFARENAIRPLVTLVSFEMALEKEKPMLEKLQNGHVAKQSFHSVVQINKQMDKGCLSSFNFRSLDNGFVIQGRMERENETPEMKLMLKTSCAQALMMLARGSLENSKRITETKGLLCLAKLIETEKGELQINCLVTIMEITAMAESNVELRRNAFKTTSPAAKAVVDQLLHLISNSGDPKLQIPAMRSIGSLARTFPARRAEVVVPIVEQLGNQNQDVAVEAAMALGKFACSDNFNCVEHTKTILEYNGVNSLLRLLRCNEIERYHVLVLLCYLALHVGDNEVSEYGRMLAALEGADHGPLTQNPVVKKLLPDAISRLKTYHAGGLPCRLSYTS